MTADVEVHVRGEFSDAELNGLHADAFDHDVLPVPWNERVSAHSLTWLVARCGGVFVGFINVIGDGGAHAVALDTCVSPSLQGRGIGRSLVEAAAQEAQRLGCHWLHVDYEPHLVRFYEGSCGLRPTNAGLLRLSS